MQKNDLSDHFARTSRAASHGQSSDLDVRNQGDHGIDVSHDENPMNQTDAHHFEKLRVLVLAEACNPQWSSVPLVGYNQVKALAMRQELEVTLVTHVRNREALQGDPVVGRLHALEFVDSDTIARPMFLLGKLLRGGKSLGWTTNMALAWPGYVHFERLVRKRFGKAIREGAFDVIHRITPVSPTLPSPIAGWSPIPFVVGPLNGGLAWPAEYPELKKGEREWLIPLRRAYRWLPWHRRMRRCAAAILSGSRSTAGEMGDVSPDRLHYLPENGFDPDLLTGIDLSRPEPTAEGRPLTLISVARLVPYKALDIAMDALAGCREAWSRWTIVGDGPLLESLKNKAAELGLTDRVEFTGWIPQADVVRRLAATDVLVQPSLREFGGGAVLEAMACGAVPVIVDYGGPAELVGEGCGIKLPMAPRAVLTASLTQAVKALRADPFALKAMSDHARSHVDECLTWSAKAGRLVDLYRKLAKSTVRDRADAT